MSNFIKSKQSVIKNYYLAFLALFIGVLVTILLCLFLIKDEERHAKERFLHDAKYELLSIENELKTHFVVLTNLASLYNASQEVTLKEFTTFTKPAFEGDYSAAQALEWIPRITKSEREKFVEKARKHFPSYEITIQNANGEMVKAPEKNEYYPVYYVYPYSGNEQALGYDLSSNLARLEALNKAKDTGKMMATEDITLVQKQTSDNILIYAPVYKKNVSIDSVTNRRKNLQGFVLGVYNVGNIIKKVLDISHLKPRIEIVSLSSSMEKNFIGFYQYVNEELCFVPEVDAKEIIAKEKFAYEKKVDVAGKTWLLRIYSPAAFLFLDIRGLVNVIGASVFGLLLSLLVFVYFYKAKKHEFRLKKYKVHLEEIVDEKTHEIKESNIELQKAHTKLKDSMQTLIQTEKIRILGTFVAGTAHELNNPLTGALNFVQYCIDNADKDSKEYKILKDTEREIESCITIVKNLLTFSVRGTEMQEALTAEHFSTLIDRVLLLLSFRIKKDNVEVILNIPEDAKKVLMQANKVQQVFLNLITNALDALKDSKTKKLIITEKTQEDMEIITIEDTGKGMSKEIVSNIFTPFYTTKGEGIGTGLGLSIVKRLIDEHKGKISCKSTLGQGTKFIVEIPLQIKEISK